MQLLALVGVQNGVALAASLLAQPADLTAALLVPLACLVLPLPPAAGLLMRTMLQSPDHSRIRGWLAGTGLARLWLARTGGARTGGARTGGARTGLTGTGPTGTGPTGAGPTGAGLTRLPRATQWPGWIDLALAVAMFAATLIVPLHALAAIFAPLLGLDGVLRAWVRRKRPALTKLRRGAALAQSGFSIVAVCAPDLITAWLALLAAMAMALLPTLSRRWGSAVLAFLAAGIALFGILLLQGAPPVLGYFSLFAGFAAIAAVVPELAVVLVILILGLANQAPWPQAGAAIGAGIAVVALLACAALLSGRIRSHRATLLVLGQASIAALAICLGQEAGRFAALVLLILLILTRSAARVMDGPAATLALAGLGGIPPLGVFPGVVLVVLALSALQPWLLLPVGLALIPFAAASVPRRLPEFARHPGVPSVAWLPLALTVLTGYFAPDQLVHWLRLLTAGAP
jgi:hypothetical protein